MWTWSARGGRLIAGHAHPRGGRGGAGGHRPRRPALRGAPPRPRSSWPRRWPGGSRRWRSRHGASSGTEATMSAARLARAATGRAKLVKFAGCYHGHADALLAAAGSGVATLGHPDSPGRDRRPDGRHDLPPYNNDRGAGGRVRRRRRPDRRRHGRAHRGQHGRASRPRPAFLAALRGRDPPRRRAAGPRRGP